MKAAFTTLLALAGTAMAGGHGGYSVGQVYTTETEYTTTTLCPITSTVTKGGS